MCGATESAVARFAVHDLGARWNAEGGYCQLLTIAFPLILSTGSWSLQHFVNGIFLTWYSPEAVAAATPAGLLSFTLMTPFIGTAGYISTFVAQYSGAQRPARIGPTVWQGLYASLGGALLMALLIPLADPLFRLVGHAPAIQDLEIAYFRILCMGAFPAIASPALAGFFSGRGATWPVLWVNLLTAVVNIALDYFLIFGAGIFPRLGIVGAANATNVAATVGMLAYGFLVIRGEHAHRYRILTGWRLEPALFSRLIRFGLPSGVQFFLDMAGFTVFLLIVGRLGTVSLAATNIALNINTLAFMPMIGLGMAVSILVGQELGRNDPGLAERCVGSGLRLTLLYMGVVATLYLSTPGLFLAPYGLYADPEAFEEIRRLSVILLRFVAIYSLFDALSIVYAAGLRGAGDTWIVMYLMGGLSLGVLIVPGYVAIEILGGGILTGWTIATVYVCLLGLAFWLRFRSGRWRSMRVIEPSPDVL